MATPALGALMVAFFYNDPSSLAVTFPDVFTGEVPQVVVCLAATMVCPVSLFQQHLLQLLFGKLWATINEYTATSIRED